MSKLAVVALGTLAVAIASACVSQKSGRGLRLPDGDVEHGRNAFVAMKCNSCHVVHDVVLPPPVAEPAVPVVLGGTVADLRTDGELITAITNPSHALAPGYPRDSIASGRLSRMGDFTAAMSVEDLVAIVAFLQSTYAVEPQNTKWPSSVRE